MGAGARIASTWIAPNRIAGSDCAEQSSATGYFRSHKPARRGEDSAPNGWKGRSPAIPPELFQLDPETVIDAGARLSVVKRLIAHVDYFWDADHPPGTTSRHVRGEGVHRQNGLFSYRLRWLSCRVSMGNEMWRGRSQAWQSPPWSLSPKGAT